MKILIIRFKQIGDAVLSSVICNTLKKTFPDSEIDYVLYEHICPLFQSHKYIDNIIPITGEEQKNPLKYISKVWKVTRKKYDIIIDIMSTPKSEIFSLFSMNSKYRIGRVKKYRGFFYTHKVKEPKDAKDKVEKFLKLLDPLKKKYSLIYDNQYTISITAKEKEMMRKRMIEAGIDFTQPVFACAVNSRRPEKVYDTEKMKIIIENLIKDLNVQIIFYYSPSEEKFVKTFHKNLGDYANVFSNIKTKSIRDLAMLLSNCDLFFGNEGGPRHIAQSLDIPSFAIFSPNASKKEWLSNACERHQGVESEDMPLYISSLSRDEKYALITPEYVTAKIKELYNKFVKKPE
ncbi:glycosyltransferase family 9 protein [Fusobacterium ulcerans]|uniref:glycosyltransferase family 9 protein n=1 Tax=Fusobacterium ulcerans TaxID=861 RepID=UPI001032C42E|nr:glycosyltransferase family 9 protein [Fusobacterium ulcerans]